MKKLLFVITAATLVSAPSVAQRGQGAGLSDTCRAEVVQLCGSAQDKQARRACMKENRSKVSESCRTEIKARMDARKSAKARPEGEAK
jgi:arylformamidase